EEPLAEVAEAGEAEVDAAVRAARSCLDSKDWRELPARKRGQLLYRVAELLEQRSQEIAAVETRNNGKPLVESQIDVAMAPATCRGPARRPGPRWYATPSSTRSPSRGRPQSVNGSCARPPRP